MEALASDLGQSRIHKCLGRIEMGIVLLLAQALFFANSFSECLDVIRQGSRRYPDDFDLMALRECAVKAYKIGKESMSYSEVEKQKGFGEVRLCSYPWMSPDLLRRTPSIVEYIRENLTSASQGRCMLKNSTVRDSHLLLDTSQAEMDVLGIFAARDFSKRQQVLLDRTCVCAVDKTYNRCSSCCGRLPISPITKPCCQVAYYSNECAGLAENFYHAGICGKDLSRIESDNQGLSTEDAVEARLLFRVLASSLHFLDLHPLEAPIINRMTSVYKDSELRTFSLARDIKRPFEMLRQLGVDTYANRNFDTWVLHTIQNRVQNNSREYYGDGRFGIAVNPLYTFFNHSCAPNVTYDTANNNSSATLRMKTLRKVKAGEEIFISYISDLGLPVAERREKLRQVQDRVFGRPGPGDGIECRLEPAGRPQDST